MVLQVEECGPWAAYVDDPAALQAQLKGILPSLQHVLADITHVMRRFSETLTPQHCKIGELVGKTGGPQSITWGQVFIHLSVL